MDIYLDDFTSLRISGQLHCPQIGLAQVDLNEAIFFICSTNKEKVRSSNRGLMLQMLHIHKLCILCEAVSSM